MVVATHLAWCATCRETNAAAEAVGGVLLSEAEPMEVSHDLLERTLLAIEVRELDPRAGDRTIAAAGRAGGPGLDMPEPLRGYLSRMGAARWRRLTP